MNLRLILRVVLLLVVALVVALVLRGIFAGAAPPPPPKTALAVAVARLPEGTLIKADDLTWRDVPEGEVKKGEITRAAAGRLNGAVVRRALDEGATVTERDVVFPDAPGFLAAALQPGLRAVSVAIDDVSGNAGLTLPGDRVDLILTHSLTNSDMRSGPPRVASETVLAAVRVIAVGQALRAPDAEASAPKTSSSNARTVTLEVSPREAETVSVASRLGHLSLALCSLAQPRAGQGGDAAEPAAPVWGRDVSQVVRMTADEEPAEVPVTEVAAPSRPQVQVFRGSDNK